MKHYRFNSVAVCIGRCLSVALVMIFLFAADRLYAQKLDSLKACLIESRGAARCSTLFEIARELIDVDDSAALSSAKESVHCAEQLHDTLQIVKGIRIQATAYSRLKEFDSCSAAILKVMPIAKVNKYEDELKYLYHYLALSQLFKGQYDDALRNNFEALALRRKLGSPDNVSTTLNNLGLVYYKLRDYRRAIYYYDHSIELLAGNDGQSVAVTLVNMALCYAYVGEPERADSTLLVALSRCKNDCPPISIENAAFCRGVVALSRNDTAAAKVHFLSSYSQSLADNNERLELDNIIYLSQIYLESGNVVEAEHYLKIAEALVGKGVSYNMELMKVYRQFARLYEYKEDYKRVAEFQRRYITFRDSTQNEEMTIGLMRIEGNHVEEEMNEKLEVQNKMLSLNEKIIARQRTAAIFEFSTIVLLGCVVVLLVRSVREKKNRNADLETRVKNRTAELESIVKQFQKALSEKKMWIDKMLSSVRHATNTVTGLSALAEKDPDSQEKCTTMIAHEMNHLMTEVSSYASRSESALNGMRNVVS